MCVSARTQHGQNAPRASHSPSHGADDRAACRPARAGRARSRGHRRRLADRRRRPLPDQAGRRRARVRACGRVQRRSRRRRVLDLPSPRGRLDVAGGADGGGRQRRLRGRVPGDPARAPPVHGARMARSLRLVASRPREAHRRGAGHHRRSGDRRSPREGRRGPRRGRGSPGARGRGRGARRSGHRRPACPRTFPRGADAPGRRA